MGLPAIAAPRRWHRQLAWLFSIGALLLLAFALGANDDPRWRTVAPGVEHRLLGPRDVQADLLRFDLERFAVDVLVGGKAAPLTAAQAAKKHNAPLAINGGFFDPQWRSLGLRVSQGKVVVPLRPHVDWGVLTVVGQRARIEHSRSPQSFENAEAAVQVGPRLLIEGQPTKLKPQVAYRSAVAVDKSGRYFTVIATHTPTDANALALALARLGDFESAMMLDGGPSSQLYAQLGHLQVDRRGAYPVPDLLIVKPRNTR